MAEHDLRVETNRALLWTDWAYRGTCSCGKNSGSGFISLKRVRKWYYTHQEETANG